LHDCQSFRLLSTKYICRCSRFDLRTPWRAGIELWHYHHYAEKRQLHRRSRRGHSSALAHWRYFESSGSGLDFSV